MGWLGVIDRTLQLIFTIGDVRVRDLSRGGGGCLPTAPCGRASTSCASSASRLTSATRVSELAFRFAVETDIDGSVLAVKFVGLRGETAILNWDVPIEISSGSGAAGRPATRASSWTRRSSVCVSARPRPASNTVGGGEW